MKEQNCNIFLKSSIQWKGIQVHYNRLYTLVFKIISICGQKNMLACQIQYSYFATKKHPSNLSIGTARHIFMSEHHMLCEGRMQHACCWIVDQLSSSIQVHWPNKMGWLKCGMYLYKADDKKVGFMVRKPGLSQEQLASSWASLRNSWENFI